MKCYINKEWQKFFEKLQLFESQESYRLYDHHYVDPVKVWNRNVILTKLFSLVALQLIFWKLTMLSVMKMSKWALVRFVEHEITMKRWYNSARHLVVIAGIIVLVPSHPCWATTIHFRFLYLHLQTSTRNWSSNEFHFSIPTNCVQVDTLDSIIWVRSNQGKVREIPGEAKVRENKIIFI